jgi:hypothetical protein
MLTLIGEFQIMTFKFTIYRWRLFLGSEMKKSTDVLCF